MSVLAGKRILISNDDGYLSDGIKALYQRLSKIADVVMVAPDREQSASSHSVTLNHPLRVHKLDDRRYTTDGTPTDCIMLAIHLLFKERKPDMIISGINHGANMGEDVTYSGTVAAAIEGAILGIPAMAVSVSNYVPEMPMTRAAAFVARLVARWDSLNLGPGGFLNVNFPPDNGKPYKDYEFSCLGLRTYKDIVIRKKDPRGRPYYWIGGRPKWKLKKGSDFDTVQRGKVSITPISMNFTDQQALDRLSELNLKI